MIRIIVAVLLLSISAASADNFDPFQKAGIDPKPGAAIPLDRTFRDETGKTVSLRSLASGKPILLVPVLHNCPNICGITLASLLQSISEQSYKPGLDFTIIAFGIDPKEGPQDAARSLQKLESAFPVFPKESIHGLTGAAADVTAVTGALGYRYAWDPEISQYAHMAATAVLTPDGHLSRWLYGVTPDPTGLKLALTEAGGGKIGTWGDQLLLLCYCYNPVTGRYDSLVSTLERVFGGITVLCVLLLVGGAVYRERLRAGRERA